MLPAEPTCSTTATYCDQTSSSRRCSFADSLGSNDKSKAPATRRALRWTEIINTCCWFSPAHTIRCKQSPTRPVALEHDAHEIKSQTPATARQFVTRTVSKNLKDCNICPIKSEPLPQRLDALRMKARAGKV
jgi:hypothetical protein